jgi:adenylate cyclase
MAGLSAAELASRAGSTPDRILHLVDLGILGSSEQGFEPEDVSRVRLAEAIDEAGISLEKMSRAIAAGFLSFSWFHGLLPQAVSLEPRTVGYAVADADLPMSVVDRMFTGLGLASLRPDDIVREDDARQFGRVGSVFESMGRDEEIFAGAIRAVGEHIREITESQMAFFRAEIVDPLFEQGLPLPEVIATADRVATGIVPEIYPLLSWLHARHFEVQWVQLFVQLVETAMEEAGFDRRPDEVPPAVAFMDLSGFTALTEESGDATAARLAEKLIDVARASTLAYGGRVVKFLGDGAMLHFPRPEEAVGCGLELVDRVSSADLPPARVGIHAGPMVFRDGDYFGHAVNTAARIVDYARPREVLASDSVVTLSDRTSVEFEEIGPVPLKGVAQPVVLHSARRIREP